MILNIIYLFLLVLIPRDIADFMLVALLAAFTRAAHLINLVSGLEYEIILPNRVSSTAIKKINGISIFSLGIGLFSQWSKFFALTLIPSDLKNQSILLLPMIGFWAISWEICFSTLVAKSRSGFLVTGFWSAFIPPSIVALVFLGLLLKLKALPIIFIMVVYSFFLFKLSQSESIKSPALTLGLAHELSGVIFLFGLRFLIPENL